MLLYKDFIFHTTEKYQLEASLYQPTGTPLNQTIIYLHGGGLIWGSRFDLPEEYIQLFLSAGYHFLTLDYPLAPEVELPEIEAASVLARDLPLRAGWHVVRGVFQHLALIFLYLQLCHLPTVPLRQAGGTDVEGQAVDVAVLTQRPRL